MFRCEYILITFFLLEDWQFLLLYGEFIIFVLPVPEVLLLFNVFVSINDPTFTIEFRMWDKFWLLVRRSYYSSSIFCCNINFSFLCFCLISLCFDSNWSNASLQNDLSFLSLSIYLVNFLSCVSISLLVYLLNFNSDSFLLMVVIISSSSKLRLSLECCNVDISLSYS